jgi:uncharacterized protein YodC (DUF2158 family)
MATIQKFKRGDEVQHKSGGPKMVVKAYEPSDSEDVVCEWMDKNHLPIERAFHQDVLKHHQNPGLRATVVTLLP